MKHTTLSLLLLLSACARSAPVAQPAEPVAADEGPPDRSTPPKSAKADCDAAYEKALAQVRANDYGKALVEVEVAIACEPLPYYQTSAFVFACMSGNSQKASFYYATLPPDQQSLRKLCERQKPPVAYDEDVASTETPETVVVPDEGISKTPECTEHARKALAAILQGQHASALSHAEKAHRCDPLPYYVHISFMAACNSQNAPKAKLLYKKLNKPEQDKFAQICLRNNTAYE